MTNFWTQHGTKLLGYVIAITSALAAGSIALPPPLSTYHVQITAWSVFLNVILGIIVTGRGYGNTAANTQAITAGVAAKAAPAQMAAPIVGAAPPAQGAKV
jgi:drug/metabolite transporter (DMT)-like permease